MGTERGMYMKYNLMKVLSRLVEADVLTEEQAIKFKEFCEQKKDMVTVERGQILIEGDIDRLRKEFLGHSS